jgi:hypothetical protein
MRITLGIVASSFVALLPCPARADDPPTTQLLIEVDDPTAAVTIDGVAVDHAALAKPIALTPGKHTVEARAEASLVDKRVVDVSLGESASIVLRLHPLRNDVIGYDLYRTSPVAPPPDSTRVDAIAVAGGAIGVVALGFGIALNIAANNAASASIADQSAIRSTTTNPSPCARPTASVASACSTLASDLASRDRLANLAVGGYLVASAAAIATVAYVFWPRGSTHVTPVIFGSNGGGAAVGGAF